MESLDVLTTLGIISICIDTKECGCIRDKCLHVVSLQLCVSMSDCSAADAFTKINDIRWLLSKLLQQYFWPIMPAIQHCGTSVRLSERQTPSGGLCGRPEKLQDVRTCRLAAQHIQAAPLCSVVSFVHGDQKATASHALHFSALSALKCSTCCSSCQCSVQLSSAHAVQRASLSGNVYSQCNEKWKLHANRVCLLISCRSATPGGAYQR